MPSSLERQRQLLGLMWDTGAGMEFSPEESIIPYLERNKDKPYLEACFDFAKTKYPLLSDSEINGAISVLKYMKRTKEAHA